MDQSIKIELLVAPGCASLESTRAMIEKVASANNLSVQIKKIVVSSSTQAEELSFLGSPSVRINGSDIDSEAAARKDYGLG